MVNTTTLDETPRAVDGTETVRLATSGANWKATLSSIFSALGGGMAIGAAVSGATPSGVLSTDSSGNLYDGAAQFLFFDPNGLGPGNVIVGFYLTFFDGDGMWIGAKPGHQPGIGNYNLEGSGNADGKTTIGFGSSGHLTVGNNLPAPTVSAGDSIAGTDLAGEITIGGGNTGTTLTFGASYSSAPMAVVTNQSGTAVSYAITNSTIIVSGCAPGDKVNYICIGPASSN